MSIYKNVVVDCNRWRKKMHIIAGKFKGRNLRLPKNVETRPTTSSLRESVFNMCQADIEGAEFLDLFAGSGAMGLEALSRGAKNATFIEKERFPFQALKANITSLGVENQSALLCLDVFRGLELLFRQSRQFDMIYIDPPYGEGLGAKVLSWLDAHPLLKKEGRLLLEESRLEEPPLKSLQKIKEKKAGRATLYVYTFSA